MISVGLVGCGDFGRRQHLGRVRSVALHIGDTTAAAAIERDVAGPPR
jgi:hypothetical protein